MHATYVAEVIC